MESTVITTTYLKNDLYSCTTKEAQTYSLNACLLTPSSYSALLLYSQLVQRLFRFCVFTLISCVKEAWCLEDILTGRLSFWSADRELLVCIKGIGLRRWVWVSSDSLLFGFLVFSGFRVLRREFLRRSHSFWFHHWVFPLICVNFCRCFHAHDLN